MRRLAVGEESALGDLMRRWGPRVRAYFLRMTGSETAAEDLAEEVFVRLYHGRTRYSPGSSPHAFSSWLFGIAANLARDHLRWKKRHPTTPLEGEPDPVDPDSPGSLAESRETVEAVRRAIAQLPDELRETVILCEYEDMAHAEIAAALGCTPKAVERRLSKARELLRRALRRWL